MPYFATVIFGQVHRVERIERYVMENEQGQEVEALGQAFLATLYPDRQPGDFIQCWYPVGQPDPYPRGCFPGNGYTWNGTVFHPPAGPDAAD